MWVGVAMCLRDLFKIPMFEVQATYQVYRKTDQHAVSVVKSG